MQARKELNEYLDDTLINKQIKSKVPASCKISPCILGIDEAGRGPVLGPMVYAVAYYPQKHENTLSSMKFADSKELTEQTRERLFESLQTKTDGFQDLGYVIKIISPNMISNCMLRRKKYNLNLLSHDTAIALIKAVEAEGIPIAQIYIDTVGPAIKYKEKMQKFFPKYLFTVAEKADSKYPIVSAASVCAKVMRDRIVKNWKYAESASLNLDTFNIGSGYPADPETKKFIERSIDPIFGFSTFARFSWSTITKALEKGGCSCDWNEPEDEEEDPRLLFKQRAAFKNFFVKGQPKVQPSKRVTASTSTSSTSKTVISKPQTNADKFFQDRCMSRVMKYER